MNPPAEKKFLLTAYWIAIVVELAAKVFELQELEYVAKPSLMILLGFYFNANIPTSKYNSFAKWIIAALFFSWGGDVFLMFVPQSEHFFLAGLGSFLIAHICYIVAFFKTGHKASQPSFLKKKPWIVLLLIAYEACFLWLLKDGLGEMAVPVVIYATVISAMAAAALNRRGRVHIASYLLVLMGAMVFICSDSMIAINKFVQPIPYAGVWIMLTYTIAQYYIVRGALIQLHSTMGD